MSESNIQYRVVAVVDRQHQDFHELENDEDAERRWMYVQRLDDFIVRQRLSKRELRTNQLGQLVFMLFVLTNAVLWYKYCSRPMADAPNPDQAYCDALDRQKCENGGLLINTATSFVCQCAPNFYGERCSHALAARTNVNSDVDADMRRGAPDLGWWFWPFTSEEDQLKHTVSFYQDHLQRIRDGLTADDSENGPEETRAGAITRSRVLPPSRPLFCREDKSLPPTDLLYKEIFQRKPDGFVRDTKRRNVLSYAFYQFFVLQFFDAEPNSAVTATQLYGTGEKVQNALRSFSGGKLKTEVVNGEQYPPRLSLGDKIKAVYGRGEPIKRSQWYNRLVAGDDAIDNSLWSAITGISLKPQWATGHPLLSSNHLLFTVSTLWVREHNRVCDELAKQWPAWTDDELYSVAKNIVLAQMMRIMLNDILDVQHLKYDPETFQDHVKHTKSFNTPFELLLTTVLPTGVPDMLGTVKMHSMLSNDNSPVLEYGLADVVRRMCNEKMGEVSSNNDGVATEPLTKFLMKLSRENAVQSFNNYRRHLGLAAYGSFYELTEDRDTASALEALYGNVENVELLTGVLTEKRCDRAVPTFTVMTNSFIVNSILTNSLGNSHTWTPKTFGGDFGFDLVKSATLKTFVRNNLVDTSCDDDYTFGAHDVE